MKAPVGVPAAAVFHRARGRLRTRAAIRLAAHSLWWLAGAAWCGWLVHRFAIALPSWFVPVLLAGGVAAAAGAIALRLPGATPGVLEADRILGARSLLVSALELAHAGAPDTPATRRIAREANAAAPGWMAELIRRLPVRWPTHGTAALLATAAATILLSLPGVPGDPAARAAAAPAAGTTPRRPGNALDPAPPGAGPRAGNRDDAAGSADATPAAGSTHRPRRAGLDPTDGLAPEPAPTATATAPPTGGAAAGATASGDEASGAPAGSPVRSADRGLPETGVSTTAMGRRGAPGGENPAYAALALDARGARGDGGSPANDGGPDAPDRYYLSPAMSRYLDRYARTQMETRP